MKAGISILFDAEIFRDYKTSLRITIHPYEHGNYRVTKDNI